MAVWTPQATDDFFRANEAPLAGSWGAWAGNAGNRFNLTSNCAQPSNLGTDMVAGWNARAWAQDQSSKIQVIAVTGTGAGSGPGCAVRFIEGAHTSGYSYYRMTINKGASNNVRLDRWDSGVQTAGIATWTVAHTDLDTYELQVEGLGAATVLTALHNSVQFGSFSDPSGIAAVGMPGICYSSTTTLAQIDDFVGSEVVVPEIIVPRALSSGLRW